MFRTRIQNGFVSLLVIAATATPLWAQGTRPSPAEIKSLDSKAAKVEQDFLKSLVELATDYEKAGDVERAKEMLQSILKIKPNSESVKSKLTEFENEVFDRKSTTIDLDVSRGWTNAGVMVTKDQPIRVEATGSYRLMVNEELGPKGYVQKDAAQDLISSVPTGALIGMIAPATRKRNQKPPVPFLLGDAKELKPSESGILFVRVNTPPQAKCTGKIKVKLSGNITRP
ncbi:tetratricopeptide repeat protein [Thalassoglobus sp.]|uniref:tetratricopeptide repeat protein n=1 Tax=Thalassoglobus sp. TaxID=2795869 RepID=UPI003AA9737C